MSDRIGPTFWVEIAAAGISPDGFSVDRVTGVPTFDPSLSAADRSRVQAVIDAHDPTKVSPATRISPLAFMALFTPTEQAAILTSTDPRVVVFRWEAAATSTVDLASADVIGGVKLLEGLGLMGQGRAAQALAGQAPPAS